MDQLKPSLFRERKSHIQIEPGTVIVDLIVVKSRLWPVVLKKLHPHHKIIETVHVPKTQIGIAISEGRKPFAG